MENGANEAQMIQRIVLSGSVMVLKITGSGSMKIAKFLSAVTSGEMSTSGEIKLKTLLKSGEELKVFSIRGTDNFRDFVKGAGEYGIVYSVIAREPEQSDQVIDYEIMVKAKDASKINRVIEKYNLISLTDDATITEDKSSKDTSKDNKSELIDDKKMSIEDARYLMSQMMEQDRGNGNELNPVEAPENEGPSGDYLTEEMEVIRIPNMPVEERSSVIEEIKDISAEMPDNNPLLNPAILSQLLSEEEISEEDKLKVFNINNQLQDVLNNVAEIAGGENINA